jgi:GT2 family glycosyltransferase
VSDVRIAFVCVNYDGFDYTKKMVISLLQQSGIEEYFDINIVVVDNSPQIDTNLITYCKSQSKVNYIRCEKNEGYFSGLNMGIRSIATETFDFVIACNNDLEFDSSFCLNLQNTIVAEHTQIICPDVITLDGVHQNPHHLHALSQKEILAFDLYFTNYYLALTLLKIKQFFKFINPFPKVAINDYEQNLEVNQGVGACYVLTEHFFKSHKELFFPSFLYGEEATLSWQVRSSGGHLVYNSSLKVLHAESASLSKLPARQTYEFGKKSYWLIRKYLF